MKWAVLAKMRTSKEETEFYTTAFSVIFQTCHSDFPQFEPEGSLKGIIMDWSDTETKVNDSKKLFVRRWLTDYCGVQCTLG